MGEGVVEVGGRAGGWGLVLEAGHGEEKKGEGEEGDGEGKEGFEF